MGKKVRGLRRIERNIVHETGQAMHVLRKTEVRSCNNFCSGKTICVTYS